MSEQKHPWFVRFLPSLTDAAFIMPLVFLFFRAEGTKTLLGDGDTGWHIRTGEWILANGQVPRTDLFSYTKAGEPWFAWEWLWDVIFAWLHQYWGLAGVVFASILVICVTSMLLFRLVRRKCDNDFIAIGITFLAMTASSLHWLARPHLFTLLFVVIFLHILERARDGNTRFLWILPFLTVLWTNLHGGFIAGLSLILGYAAGEMATFVVEGDWEQRKASLARSRPYFFAALASGAATFLNPYGYKLHTHIYAYLTNSYHFRNISEFLPLSFQAPVAIYVQFMLLAGTAAAFLSLARKQFVFPVLFLFWARMGLYSVRNIPIFVLITAPFAAATLVELLGRLRGAVVASWVKRAVFDFEKLAAEFGTMDRIRRFHVPIVAAAGLVAVLLYAPSDNPRLKAEYDPKNYPAAALEILRRPEFSSGVFTHDEWGDYLIYHLYPAARVFIDGRSDFYGEKFGNAFLDVMRVHYDWEKNLRRHGVTTVLLPAKTALAGAMKESNRWRIVYDDGIAIVFRPAAAAGDRGDNAGSHAVLANETGCDWMREQREPL